MTAISLHDTVIQLEQHVRYKLNHDPDANEEDAFNSFLDSLHESLDLGEADYLSVLEEYDRRKRAQG